MPLGKSPVNSAIETDTGKALPNPGERLELTSVKPRSDASLPER